MVNAQAHDIPAGIGHDTGGAQVVFEDVVEGVASASDIDPHRSSNGIVHDGSGDAAAGGLVHFVNSTYVNGLAPIGFCFLRQVAITTARFGRLRAGLVMEAVHYLSAPIHLTYSRQFQSLHALRAHLSVKILTLDQRLFPQNFRAIMV